MPRILSTPWLAAAVLTLHACANKKDQAAPPARQETRIDRGVTTVPWQATVSDEDRPFIRLHLQDAEAYATPADPPPTASAHPLPASRLDALLSRLPDPPATDARPFRQVPDTTPPPRPGEDVTLPFPPPPRPADIPDALDDRPLEIVRVTPEGHAPILPRLTVAFNRPVVPLTPHAKAAEQVPITIAPMPEDAVWRYIGTRTLVLEPAGARLPMATSYTVTLDAGRATPTGAVATTRQVHTLATPPVSVQARTPEGGPTVRQPVIALRTDQAIAREALQAHLRLTADGAEIPLRAATAEEIAADPAAQRLVAGSPPDRWVAVRPIQPLAPSTVVEVTLDSGAPSAEGPRRTSEAQGWNFTTHGPLAAKEIRCGWRPNDPCRPGQPWTWRWSNPVDPDQDLTARIAVEPAVRDLSLSAHGNQIHLRGLTTPRTTYTVTADASLRDVFGQTLGAPARARIQVGPPPPATPQLLGPRTSMVVPDPRGEPAVTFHARGMKQVRVRVHPIGPGDLEAWRRPPRFDHGQTPAIPGRALLDEVRDLSDPEVWRPIAIDLSAFDGPETFALAVQVESPPGTSKSSVRYQRNLVVPTRLGLATHHDADTLVAWVTDLRTGRGVEGAAVSLWRPDGGTTPIGRTGEGGLYQGPLPEPGVLRVRHGDDEVWATPHEGLRLTDAWGISPPPQRTLFHVFDDRHLYRPGETVHVKGWARQIDLGKGGDVRMPPPTGALGWTLHDAQRVELGTGQVDVDAHGGFDLDVDLPDTPNLGTARLTLRGLGGGATHTFDIQAFRRPTFEVSTALEAPGPFVIGDAPVATVTAAYLAGGPLAGADVSWSVQATPATWRAPGWDRFDFDPEVSWWWGGGHTPPPRVDRFDGLTDATGAHRLRLGLGALRTPRTLSVQASATVQDVDRQTFTDATPLLVHPARLAIGVRPDKPFFDKGEPATVQLVVTDLDGEPVADRPIEAALILERARWDRGQWTTEEVTRLPCTTTSRAEPVACTFQPERGGAWRVEAAIADDEGRPWEAAQRVWVSGGEPLPQADSVDQQKVLLTPDAEAYAPGDTARILVTAPFAPADALITWRRAGIVHQQTRRLPTASTTLEVPIEEGMTPELTVRVALTGLAPDAGDPAPPAFAKGHTSLAIPPAFRALDVDVLPAQAQATPGSRTQVKVRVAHDASPVAGAQVAVVMVDEAVLALTDRRVGDPLATFHPARGDRTREGANWTWIQLDPARDLPDAGGAMGGALDMLASEAFGGAPRGAALQESAPSSKRMRAVARSAAPEADAASAPPAPIALREDFRANAVWVPAATTDARGEVTVPVDLPDSLTRYRITAVAVHDRRAGLGDASLTARLPLQVRPSAPRFLNVGDQAELPFVVHNRTDEPMDVDLGVRGTNLSMAHGDRDGRRFTVPAQDRVEVRIPAKTVQAGTIHLQAAVAARALADAATVSLPVLTPATREAFATYGELAGPEPVRTVRQGLAIPDDVYPAFGGLDLSTSTTRLSALTDAVIHLHDLPFMAVEPRASRVLAVSALREVLDAFDADGLPDPAALEAQIADDLQALAQLRNPDGGWPWWQRGRPSSAFVSLHTAHALWRAHDAGLPVDASLRTDAIAQVADAARWLPDGAHESTRQVVRAYGIYLLTLSGQDAADRARALWKPHGTDLPLTAQALILPTLHHAGDTAAVDAIGRHLRNRITETAYSAELATTWSEADAAVVLHSDRRLNALALESWLRVWPDDDVLPGKLVEGLLGHRQRGHWGSTQDNGWVLVAMQRYFRDREGEVPDLVARAWVGEALVADRKVEGRTTEQASVRVPLTWLTDGRSADEVIVAREGTGRLYWRLGLRYAPRDLQLPPAEHGFSVSRRYEAVDDPEDVVQRDDGTWEIRAGARVRVDLWMTAPARRFHVALTDPLPAGLEPLNPALVGTEDAPPAPNARGSAPWSRGWWWGPWYEHENLRDHRVEAYARSVWAGVHRYTYTARATTPGIFVAMPARAEEMYHPETFGRTGTETVKVIAAPPAGPPAGP